MLEMPGLMVSVVMITYGQEKYIEQAIEGVLMQQIEFPVEVIIANDHSPDNTDGIVWNYINNHPKGNLIRYFNHAKNIGMMPNSLFVLNQAKGKYIAICEGDDYWTDPLKVQKQVDFLEANKKYSMVCHDALVIDEMTNTSSLFFGSAKKKQICTTRDALNIHFCPSASIVFRRQAIFPLNDFNLIADAGDQALVQFISLNGLLYRMQDVMSVYRKTATGMSELMSRDLAGTLEKRITSLKNLNKIANYKYQKNIWIENLLIKNRINLLKTRSKIRITGLKINKKILSFIKEVL